MSVDILLATYNGEAYIREQIDSLLGQTYRDIRVIVRDDGSTDATREIVAEYAGKIEIIFDHENLGPQQNFARLMRFSTGEYIMFCDQDDVWKSDKVENSLKCMKQLEAAWGNIPLLVHTDLCVVDKDLEVLAPSFWEYVKLNPKNNTLNRLIVQNVVTGCTMLMNRALLELSKNIPKEAVMHDWWIALVAAAFGKIAFLDEATIYYRQHGKNQVGASKYSLISLIKKGLTRRKFRVQHKQIEAFYNLYKVQKEMFESYLSLPFCNYLTVRYRIIKFRFFRSGMMRNIGLFLFSKHP